MVMPMTENALDAAVAAGASAYMASRLDKDNGGEPLKP
jgi:hypothetical protein